MQSLLRRLYHFLTGFNRDTVVDVSAIKVAGFTDKVKAFNHSVEEIQRIGEERAAIGLQIDDELAHEKKGHGGPSIELIKLRSEVAILSSYLDQAKLHSSDLRAEFRKMKFSAVKEGDLYQFFEKGAEPQGAGLEGKTWRLAISNNNLDSTSLKLTGGGAIVGKIPEGLPTLAVPDLTLKTFLKLLPTAVIISLLGFMEAIAIAKAMAAQTGQKLDPNQELIGQGLANILGSIGSSYAVSGSFSRSAALTCRQVLSPGYRRLLLQ